MDCKRKSSWFWSLGLVVAVFGSCGNPSGKVVEPVVQNAIESCRIDTVPVQNGPDLTVYGRGGDFGMSTFSLVTSEGKKYQVTRVSEAGDEGRIWGSVAPGGKYALMMDNEGEALKTLINLQELESFVGNSYYIYNGELVLTLDGNREWVDIDSLSTNKFVAQGRGGTRYSFHK